MHHRYERVFMRACESLKLVPSRWIPHIKLPGLYEMGTQYEAGDPVTSKGTPVPVEVVSLYDALETVCRERAIQRLGLAEDEWMHRRLGFWYEFWGFLAEVDLGVYDWNMWSDETSSSVACTDRTSS